MTPQPLRPDYVWVSDHLALLESLLAGNTDLGALVGLFRGMGYRAGEILQGVHLLWGMASDGVLRPVDRAALVVLCGRARRDGKAPGGFRLDGRPADLRRLIMAANSTLRAFGYRPIPYPGACCQSSDIRFQISEEERGAKGAERPHGAG